MNDAFKERAAELIAIFDDTPMTVQGCITRPDQRITQLYRQAYSNARLKENPKWKPSMVSESAISITQDVFDEFARLLLVEVLEELDTIGNKASNNISWDDTDLFINSIKQHFDIK